LQPVRTTGEPLIKDMGTGTQGAFHLQPGQWTDDSSMGMFNDDDNSDPLLFNLLSQSIINS
jgi:hypothetical protein